jgi:peptidoglycan-associated lipoprotein
MKITHLTSWAVLAAAAVLAGCASAPRDGSEQTEYYVAKVRQGAPIESPTVQAVEAPPAPPMGQGPAGVAHAVYFAFDKWNLEPQYVGVVQAHADYLRANPQRRVLLEGHADERGTNEYNIALGQRRAETVRTALRRMGVADHQMEAVSYGEERPVCLEKNEECYARNRRVEFNYR